MDRFKSEERIHPKFPIYTGPGKFLNGQELTRIRFSFTVRNPRKRASFWTATFLGKSPPTPPLGQHQHLRGGRGRWAVSQKCIMILNSTAICNRIWTVPCYRVSQVKEIVRSKICLDSGKNPSIPARYRYASVYNIIANCSLRFSPESRKCLTFLFFFVSHAMSVWL